MSQRCWALSDKEHDRKFRAGRSIDTYMALLLGEREKVGILCLCWNASSGDESVECDDDDMEAFLAGDGSIEFFCERATVRGDQATGHIGHIFRRSIPSLSTGIDRLVSAQSITAESDTRRKIRYTEISTYSTWLLGGGMGRLSPTPSKQSA